LADESNGLIVEDHCLLHAVQNTFKEIFQLPILKSLLQQVIEVILTCRKPSLFERYEGHRKRHNEDILRARKLGEEAPELRALPRPETDTAPRLGLPSDTRFGTNFICLQNFLSNLPVLRQLDDEDLTTSLNEVDIHVTKRIVDGLSPLYRLMRLGDSKKSGGVSKAHAAFEKLRDHLRLKVLTNAEERPDDIFVSISNIVTARWRGWHREHHILAYVLDPEYWWDVDAISGEERVSLMRKLRAVMRTWCRGDDSYFKSSWGELMTFMDPANSATRDAGWYGEGVHRDQARSIPIATYWRDYRYGVRLPNLAKIGEEMASLTVSAASPERLWSRSGWILDRRRSKLKTERVSKLIILNSDLRSTNTAAVSFHAWRDQGDDARDDARDDAQETDSDYYY